MQVTDRLGYHEFMVIEGLFETMHLDAWARTPYWPVIREMKLDDRSSFAGHFRRAEAGQSGMLATVKFVNAEPVGLAVYADQGTHVHFEVYVRPHLRRFGHGRSLFKHVSSMFKSSKIVVFPWDNRSHYFFKAVGVNMESEMYDPASIQSLAI